MASAADPNEHTIASYNMSWANSDGLHTKGDSEILLYADGISEVPSYVRVSEYEFIKRAKEAHQFWRGEHGALATLNKFVGEKQPSFIGIQEAGQIDEIRALEKLRGYNFALNEQVIVAAKPDVPAVTAKLLTFWTPALGGQEFVKHADLGPFFYEKGRPITLIYTKNGFLLINLHSPYGESKRFEGDQRAVLSGIIQEFLDIYGLSPIPSKIFIVGDFNYPNYNAGNPLRLEQVTLTGGNPGIVASCCHSYSKRKRAIEPGKSAYERGGDYCFGLNVVTPLAVFDSEVDALGGSVASDHELVYATFKSSSVAGGSRRSKRSLLRSRGSRRVRRMTKKRSRPFKNRCHRIIRQIH